MNESEKFTIVWVSALILSFMFFFGYKIEKTSPELIKKQTAAFLNLFDDSVKELPKSSAGLNWALYMKKLEGDIKNNWNPPRANESKRVVVIFRIDRDGNLLKREIKQSSNNEEVDSAALNAVDKTAPFAPLPECFSGKNIEIEFTFDYNILNKAKETK